MKQRGVGINMDDKDLMILLHNSKQIIDNVADEIGDEIRNFTLERFDIQGFNHAGEWENPHGKERMLIETGSLRNSIEVLYKSNDGAEIHVGVNSYATNSLNGAQVQDYARVHNEGGVIQRRTKSGIVSVRMPKRQFIGESNELTKRIHKIIGDEVKNLKKK